MASPTVTAICDSQHHVKVLARALPPMLKCCGVVWRQLGVADATIEADAPPHGTELDTGEE